MFHRALIGALALLLAAPGAFAQTPLGSEFTYQGQLKEGGVPANGPYDLQFTLWDHASIGTAVAGPIAVANQMVTNGLFTVPLDFGIVVFNGDARWLEVGVRPGSGVDPDPYTPLTPRQALTATPNALFALNASTADTAATATTATNATQLNGQSAAFYRNASNVNSGTLADGRLSANVALLNNTQTFTGTKTFSLAPSFTAAGAPFAVTSTTLVTNLNADRLDGLNSTAFLQSIPVPLSLSGTIPSSHTIRGINGSTAFDTVGVFGLSTAPTEIAYGVRGRSDSTSGRGVYGEATTPTGTTSGVYGESASTSGRAVFGWATALTGFTYGGRFENDSTDGAGVYGIANAFTGSGQGGRFLSNGTNGIGVLGQATHSTGTTYGVFGISDSSGGRAVFGSATDLLTGSGDNYGVYGESDSTNGRGVFGEATAASGTTYGVRGKTNSPNGYAGYFEGRGYFADNVGIGTLSPTDAPLVVASGVGNTHAQFGTTGPLFAISNTPTVGFNLLFNGAWKYGGNGFAAALGVAQNDGHFYYLTAPSGTAGATATVTSRVTILTSGQVGIGTAAPGFLLEVNGSAGKPGGGSWSVPSDVRLKKNIRGLTGALDSLSALRGVTFEYIDPQAAHELPGPRIGMIAQEVEQVFPDWVDESPSGFKRVTYRGFEALTVEALRELRNENDAQIDALKADLARKDAELADLRARLERLERLVNPPKHKDTARTVPVNAALTR